MRRPLPIAGLRSAPVRPLAALLVFAALSAWSTYPLILNVPDAVPGAEPGDNVAALWNTWWFQYAIAHGHPLYWTDKLFAPFGTQLSLHTHATVHSALAWPFTRVTTIVAAHNLAILIGLTLNGFCGYLLALRITGRFFPALAAGLVISSSAFVQLRLLGHVNLVHVWVLLLFALALLEAERARTWSSAAALGVAGALVIYTDYYFAVFCVVLPLVWVVARSVTFHVERRAGPSSLVSLVLAVMAIDLVLVVAIAVSGGTSIELFGQTISIRGIRNPLTVFWFLAVALILLRFRPTLRRMPAHAPGLRHAAVLLIALSVTLAATFPLWRALADVVLSGEYVSQRVLWRSSPPGGDALTIVLGNPRHTVTGPSTRAAYDALGIDVMEQALWLGLLPVALVLGWRGWRGDPAARPWIALAVVFGVWSLGPFLRVAGADTALPLPGALTRYLPVFSNARIPGRAVIVTQISVSILFALALKHRQPRGVLAAAVWSLLVFEATVWPAPLLRVPPPDSVDRLVAAWPVPGAVVELPLGIRDGFGQDGEFDHRALVHQISHQRPLAGGFVARLSPETRRRFMQAPIFRALAGLATDSSERLPPDSADRLRELGVLFVIANRDRIVEARLSRGEIERAGFEFLHADGVRELYRTGAR